MNKALVNILLGIIGILLIIVTYKQLYNNDVTLTFSSDRSSNTVINTATQRNTSCDLGQYVPDTNNIDEYFLKELKSRRIFFNRIPKTGSFANRLALAYAAERFGASVKCQGYRGSFSQPPEVQEEFAKIVLEPKEPHLAVRHTHFIDFTKFNLTNPSYINVVRDPFNRVVSWFYFKKYYTRKPRTTFFPTTNLTYDQCVEAKHEACMGVKEYFTIVPWFCGHENKCLKPSTYALEKAKRNLVKYYPIVGYIENIHEFYELAEKIWPHFFTGLREVGPKLLEEKEHKTGKRIPPSDKTREVMKKVMGMDYEFYYFIRQRFHCLRQYILKMKAI